MIPSLPPASAAPQPPAIFERQPVPLDGLRKEAEMTHLGPGGAPRLVPVAPFNPTGKPIVFIHGILADPCNEEVLIQQAQARGMQVWAMTYDTINFGLEANSAGFARELKALSAAGVKDFTVVAHSLGALTSKLMFDKLTGPDGRMRGFGQLKFVALSAPWGGVTVANAALYVLRDVPQLDFARELAADGPTWRRTIRRPFSRQIAFYNVSGLLDQVQFAAQGSPSVRPNYEAVIRQAKRVIHLPGDAHNTLLWNPTTLRFVFDPARAKGVAASPPLWSTMLHEAAAGFSLPWAFRPN